MCENDLSKSTWKHLKHHFHHRKCNLYADADSATEMFIYSSKVAWIHESAETFSFDNRIEHKKRQKYPPKNNTQLKYRSAKKVQYSTQVNFLQIWSNIGWLTCMKINKWVSNEVHKYERVKTGW